MSNSVYWEKKLKILFIIVIVGCSLILVFKNFLYIGDKKNSYNMNVSESINLAKVYKSSNDITWETSDDNVVIEDSVVTAKSPGKAKVVAVDADNKEIEEILINVLKEGDMAIDNHNVNLKLKQSKKIVVNNKKLSKSVVDNNNLELDNDKIVEQLSKIYPSFEISEKELFGSGIESVVVEEENVDYEYESSDESVAVVDDDGNIETVSSGDAVVTVTDDNGNEDYVHVVVDKEDIDLYATEYNLNVGEYVQVEYSLNSMLLNEKDIKWSSDDTSIALVNDSGLITAVGSGSAYITINVGNVIQKRVHVNVLENLTLPEELDISSEEVNLKVGEIQVVSANVYPYSAYNKEVTWKSDNDSIATVNNGVIRAVGFGETIVSATTVNGIRREIRVIVGITVKEVEEVKFSQHFMDMNVNDIKKVSYDILPSDAIDKSVKFYYDNNYISVDDEGNVKALKEGNTILTITTSNGKIDTMVINIKGREEYLTKYIEINKNVLDLKIGNVEKLEAILGNGKENDKLIWISSNNKIVDVDQAGNVSAISSGSAIVSVYLNSNSSVRANCYVSVKPEEVMASKIKMNTNKVELTVGDSKVLIPTIEPSNVTNKNVKWISSNEKVITVDKNGSIKAVGVGSATVKVMMDNDSKIFDNCEVSVKAKNIIVSKIALNMNSLKLVVGDTSKLSPVITPSNATDKSVKWSSNNEKIVTVDDNGNLKAVGVGNATIRVMMNNNAKIFAECNIVVNPKTIDVKKIKISKSKLSLIEGDRKKLSASVSPSNATNKKIIWESSNTKVVKVNQSGEMKAVGAGSAKIVVRSKSNPKVKVKCKVIVEKKETGAQKILNYADRKYAKMDKDGDWTWGHGHHKTTCCSFVDDVLYATGYIKKNRWLCHTGDTSKPTGLNLLYDSKVKVYFNKSVSSLEPGDVVVWSKPGKDDGNIAIFAYKKGRKYYYYGASYGKEVKDKHHPSSRMSGYWRDLNGKLTIIRAIK